MELGSGNGMQLGASRATVAPRYEQGAKLDAGETDGPIAPVTFIDNTAPEAWYVRSDTEVE